MWTLKQKSKRTEKEMSLEVMQREGGGRGNWRKVVKRSEVPLVRKAGTRDVMCHMMTTDHTAA